MLAPKRGVLASEQLRQKISSRSAFVTQSGSRSRRNGRVSAWHSRCWPLVSLFQQLSERGRPLNSQEEIEMKKLWPPRSLLIAIALFCMTATAAIRPNQTPNQGQSPNQDPPVTLLNNRDIRIMVDAGLDSEVVIKVIKASRCTFDTFPPVI